MSHSCTPVRTAPRDPAGEARQTRVEETEKERLGWGVPALTQMRFPLFSGVAPPRGAGAWASPA